jgi:hypothetical protein
MDFWATLQFGIRIKAKDILRIRFRELRVPRSEFAVCGAGCPGPTKGFVCQAGKFRKKLIFTIMFQGSLASSIETE